MGAPAGFSRRGRRTTCMDALRLNCGWYGSGLETSGQLGSVDQRVPRGRVRARQPRAVLPLASGRARAQGDKGRAAVMPGGGGGGGGGFKASGFMEWTLPFAAPSAAIWIAMFAQRHFHEYGTTREQLAWIALNARRNAALNPKAIYRDPMSMDDYLDVAHDLDAVLPLRLRRPVRRRDRGDRVAASTRRQDLRKPPLRVEAVGTAHRAAARRGTSSTTSRRWRTATRARSCGTRTDLKPADVQTGRSSTTASRSSRCRGSRRSGFCGIGESGPVHRGRRAHRPRRRAAAQHPRRPALGRPAARLRLPARGVRADVGRRRRRARSPGDPEVGVAARRRRARSPARCSLHPSAGSLPRRGASARVVPCRLLRRSGGLLILLVALGRAHHVHPRGAPATTSSSTTRATTSCRPATIAEGPRLQRPVRVPPRRAAPQRARRPTTRRSRCSRILPMITTGDAIGLARVDHPADRAVPDAARRARRGRADRRCWPGGSRATRAGLIAAGHRRALPVPLGERRPDHERGVRGRCR